MRKHLLSFFIALLPFMSPAQVLDGIPMDSMTIRFTNGPTPNYVADTAAIPLWQIGNTTKPFFTDSSGTTAIMTDTLHPYPVNANNWFEIKVLQRLNTIVDFWHKYQTNSSHAGGIVEFSLDAGTTWQNVKGPCNIDTSHGISGTLTTNFYSFNDTLLTGQPSFSGTSVGSQYSRFQFFTEVFGPPGMIDCEFPYDTIYVRFRFVSDSVADSLAGWMIDSIKIENNAYPGAVPMVLKYKPLEIYPNPAYDGVFNFPPLSNGQDFNMEVYNSLGEKVLRLPYTRSLDIGQFPKGLYFYKVTGGTQYYSGRLLTE